MNAYVPLPREQRAFAFHVPTIAPKRAVASDDAMARKYKHLSRRPRNALRWFDGVIERQGQLFAHLNQPRPDGSFAFPDLKPGVYRLSVANAGFATAAHDVYAPVD